MTSALPSRTDRFALLRTSAQRSGADIIGVIWDEAAVVTSQALSSSLG